MADETRPLLSQNDISPAGPPQASYTDPPTISATPGEEIENQNNSEDGKPKPSALTILLPVAIGTFLAAMDGTIVASSFASIGNDFNQLQNASWIATGYMLTLTSFQPLYGKLSDIFGRKACLLFAYFTFGLGCLFCGISRNMTELIAARIFTGIGGGGMTTVVSILISDIVPLRQRGTWQGILNIIFSSGAASGAPLGGILADTVGWRWTFLLQVPLTFIAFMSVLLALHLPANTTTETSISFKLRRIDFLGALTLVVAVFSLLLGLDRGSNTAWSSAFAYGPLVASLFLTIIFAVIETTPSLAAEPFAPKHIIANGSLLGSYLANFFGFAGVMCTVFHVSLYAQAVHGKSATGAGAVLIPGIFAGVSGSLFAGIVMQRTGKYKLLTVGAEIALVVGAFFIDGMVAASLAGSLIGVAMGFMLMHFGGGIATTSTLIALIANVTAADQAVATAVSYLFRSLGGVVGISIGSALVQNTLRAYLRERLTGSEKDVDEIVRRVRESLSYIDTLDPATRIVIRGSYEQALLVVFCACTGMVACALVSSLFIREESLERPGDAK